MPLSAEQAQRGRFIRSPGGGPLWYFLRGFLKHPVMVGSVIASTKTLQNTMLKRVDWANTKLFVEYGPGVGTFCRPVLDRLRRDGMLIVIDTNPLFIDYLRKTISDSRFDSLASSPRS